MLGRASVWKKENIATWLQKHSTIFHRIKEMSYIIFRYKFYPDYRKTLSITQINNFWNDSSDKVIGVSCEVKET